MFQLHTLICFPPTPNNPAPDESCYRHHKETCILYTISVHCRDSVHHHQWMDRNPNLLIPFTSTEPADIRLPYSRGSANKPVRNLPVPANGQDLTEGNSEKYSDCNGESNLMLKKRCCYPLGLHKILQYMGGRIQLVKCRIVLPCSLKKITVSVCSVMFGCTHFFKTLRFLNTRFKSICDPCCVY